MSTMQKSASLPTERLPLFIFNIFAGLEVKALIIVSNFTEPLWYNSKLRDNKVSKHVAKKLLLNFMKEKGSHTFPDGMKDDYVLFRGIKSTIGFRCYIYKDGSIDYRYSNIEKSYDDWLFKKFNEK